MVVYVSPAEKNGGILQFSITMLEETMKFSKAILFLPNSVENKHFENIEENVVLYEKIKTLNPISNKIIELSKIILSRKPDCVVFLEDSLLMQQLNYLLVRKNIKTAIVVHDVIRHPYRNMNIRKIVVDAMRRICMKKTVNQNNAILLLSKNSKKIFELNYKKKKARLVIMNLGAHVPNVYGKKPIDLPSIREYFLFFGRIDKYKGIANLCQAYTVLPIELKEKNNLIIAGNGLLSDSEKDLIENDKYIVLLNRFIEDNEMVWLYQNAKAVVLPYIEASQSGVLPIAYHFSKPVIVSNQEGLLENLKYGKTGYSYKTIDELSECLKAISFAEFGSEVCDFYEVKFNWQKNIRKMLEEI